MKKLFFLSIVFFLTTSLCLQAQEEEKPTPVNISGSVDTYFRQNLSADNNTSVPGSSFANQSGFGLGMVNIIAGYEGEKVGFVGDLVFGPRGTDAVFASTTASSSIVNQLYVYWNVSDKVTLTMGNFNTFLGYEVISPTANFNYSTSYMFSYGPFSHTGLKADIALSDELSLMLGVFNPTDLTDFNPTDSYTLGAQLGYENESGGAWLNFLYGDQDGSGSGSMGKLFQVDLTTGFSVSETVYLGFNGTLNSTQDAFDSNSDGEMNETSGFAGAAVYLQNSFSETFALGIRGEYFSETGAFGAIGGFDEDGDASVFDITLSANINVGPLKLIPELRLDAASEDIFADSDSEPNSSLSSFVLAAVYSF